MNTEERFNALPDETRGFIIMINHAFGGLLFKDKRGLMPVMEWMLELFSSHDLHSAIRIIAHAFEDDTVYFVPWCLDEPNGWELVGSGMSEDENKKAVEFYVNHDEELVAVPLSPDLIRQVGNHNKEAMNHFEMVIKIALALEEQESWANHRENTNTDLMYKEPTQLN